MNVKAKGNGEISHSKYHIKLAGFITVAGSSKKLFVLIKMYFEPYTKIQCDALGCRVDNYEDEPRSSGT